MVQAVSKTASSPVSALEESEFCDPVVPAASATGDPMLLQVVRAEGSERRDPAAPVEPGSSDPALSAESECCGPVVPAASATGNSMLLQAVETEGSLARSDPLGLQLQMSVELIQTNDQF